MRVVRVVRRGRADQSRGRHGGTVPVGTVETLSLSVAEPVVVRMVGRTSTAARKTAR